MVKYNVFIYCGGKCGGTTLARTFSKNGYKTCHLHSSKCKGNFKSDINLENDDIYNIINNSCKTEKVYIIDSYRLPIERKISSFFQNIQKHIPNYNNLLIEEIIKIFNEKFLVKLENYHSINEILSHYKLPLFEKQDKLIEIDIEIKRLQKILLIDGE